MPSRRADITMTPDEQTELLDSQPFGVLGTVGPSGAPHQVNVGFIRDGIERVVTSSFRGAQKVRNVHRSPRASLLVEVTAPYHEIRGVLLSGAAAIVDDPARVASWHYRMKERSARLVGRRNLPPADDEAIIPKRVLLVLSVERAVSWDHRKLGGVY